MHTVIERCSQYSPGTAGTGTRNHSPVPEFVLSTAENLYSIVWTKFQNTAYYVYMSYSYLFSTLLLRKDMTLTQLEKNKFRLTFVKRLLERKENEKNQIKCKECCSCSFYQHSPKPEKKSSILPLTSKRCSFHPLPVASTPCSVSPHSGTLPTHFPEGNLQLFSPLLRYPRAFVLTAEQAGLSETTSHCNTQRGTRRDGQAPALTAQALADYKLLETKH